MLSFVTSSFSLATMLALVHSPLSLSLPKLSRNNSGFKNRNMERNIVHILISLDAL